jgi:hypothetical protein
LHSPVAFHAILEQSTPIYRLKNIIWILSAMEEEQCVLIQGFWAVLCQILLFLLALSTLVYKRSRENPKIPYDVWILDVSKQMLSSGAAHGLALAVAIWLTLTKDSSVSECSWYSIMYSVDTILGTLLTYIFHRLAIIMASKRLQASSPDHQSHNAERFILESIVTCGHYGDPPSLRRWAWQALEWILCVLAARSVCGFVVFMYAQGLEGLAASLDTLFGSHPTLQLYVVMIIYPLCMNSAQVLIQDAILRAKSIFVPVLSS